MSETAERRFPIWRQPDGAPVTCREKIEVLNENLEEIRALAQDALEDAILMGCAESQVRETLHGIVDALENPYAGTRHDAVGGGGDSGTSGSAGGGSP